ncbi:hypothetical protein K2173_005248 [Erythroxylum novogranatense]|uniref:Uncharacterized protein n=1 Tax=Erythroxylum novogranatense TaxID=1862640 RepID=A0AAV8TRR4_9ROSI|nr:hypothetical protein K2173_005248 [Erythroxylum novogranatense]
MRLLHQKVTTEYQDTVITMSNDQYVIKQIVNRVVEVKDCQLQNYEGDYNCYLEKNLDARERELERDPSLRRALKVKVEKEA